MGNKMFSFITHSRCNVIAGGPCPFDCCYCWATALKNRYQWEKYQGEYRLLEKELRTYPSGSFVFVQDMGDIGDPKIPKEVIQSVFSWMQKQKEVKFLLLTKNPKFYRTYQEYMQPHIYAGATIESDMIPSTVSKAPSPYYRMREMVDLKIHHPEIHRFVSIEPIMDFTPSFTEKISEIQPEFVAVGYDGYNNKLPEPSLTKTEELIDTLESTGIKVYRKTIREARG